MADIKILGKVFNGVSKLKAQNASGEGTTEFSVGGGGSTEVPENDVIFIDYDGTILYSYSKSEFANLSALPANPVHEGLTAQGWNWTLSDAKSYVSVFGGLVIGQEYNVTDEKIHIFINIPETSMRKNFQIAIAPSVENSATIDWGDNNTTDCSSTTVTTYSHDYSIAGKYEIKISCTNDAKIKFGSNSIVGYDSYTDSSKAFIQHIIGFIESVWLSSIFMANTGSKYFANCYNLLSCLIAKNCSLTASGSIPYLLYYCEKIKGFVVHEKESTASANSKTNIGNYVFSQCYNLKYVSLPKSMNFTSESSPIYICSSAKQLKRLYITDNATKIPYYLISNACNLEKFIVPSGVTALGNNAFNACCLKELVMLPTSPPTCPANALTYFPNDAKIYVPISENHTVLDSYKAASGWSTYASQIEEMPT